MIRVTRASRLTRVQRAAQDFHMAKKSFPNFRYHPDPISTGAFKKTKRPCVLCGIRRGFTYAYDAHNSEYRHLPYARNPICPWCIASGVAARRDDAVFTDHDIKGWPRVPKHILKEVDRRTPGLRIPNWSTYLGCCNDVMAFTGYAGLKELQKSYPDALPSVTESIKGRYAYEEYSEATVMETLDKKGIPTACIFRCLHCDRLKGYVAGVMPHDAPRRPKDKKKIAQLEARAFRIIDKHLLPASVAELVPLSKSTSPTCSRFGGCFVGSAGESWPQYDGKPMLPILQIRTDEVPLKHHAFVGISLLTLFVSNSLPVYPSKNGEGWLLRGYNRLTSLVPLPMPAIGVDVPRPHQIKWLSPSEEGPSWDDAARFDIGEYAELDTEYTAGFHKRYKNSGRTKVGGWPALIQGGLPFSGDIGFQVGTESKAKWSWGHGGIAYFTRDKRGVWHMDWQCY